MWIDPVIGRASIDLRLARSVQGRLSALAAGRPIVIDYFASRLRGVAVGDLTVECREPRPEACYVELEPIEGVLVLAHRRLARLLDGAELSEAGLPWNRNLTIVLAQPEEWIEFLDCHGHR